MKNKLTEAAVILVTIIVAGAAFASDTSRCDGIQNPDQRALCRAEVSGQQWHCAGIQNMDRRLTCEALASGQNWRCDAIQDLDERQRCKANSNMR